MQYSAKLTFGKYKGQEWKSVPFSYILWMAEQDIRNGSYNWSEMAREYIKQSNYGKSSQDEIEAANEQDAREREEWQEMRARQLQEEAYRDAHPDLEWTLSTGQLIKVWVDDEWSCTITVNGEKHTGCMIVPVPASQQAQAKRFGVVAKLRMVGLTAERKAFIEKKMNSFK